LTEARYFDIGKVVNTHGIRGEIKIIPITDDPNRFTLLDEVEIFLSHRREVYPLISARPHKKSWVLKLDGVHDCNAAERLVGGVLKVPPEKALPLEEGEYYQRDLLDMNVITEQGEALGKLVQIIETGANDVYRVLSEGGEEILIPAIQQCILAVSVPERQMTVHLLEGLR
jgi:16S rRNA processing protein RimM